MESSSVFSEPMVPGMSIIIKMLATIPMPNRRYSSIVWVTMSAKKRNEVRSSIGVFFQDPAVNIY